MPPNSGGRMPTRDYFANAAGSALTRSAIALRRLLYNYRQRECGDGRCICLPHAVINQFQLGRAWRGRIAQCKVAGRAGQIFIGRKLRLSQRLQRTRQRFYPLPIVAPCRSFPPAAPAACRLRSAEWSCWRWLWSRLRCAVRRPRSQPAVRQQPAGRRLPAKHSSGRCALQKYRMNPVFV